MNDLLALPYEVQIVLVSGYLGYKLSSAGRERYHRTEDFVLQVVAFGLVSRAITLMIISGSEEMPFILLLSIIGSLSIAGIWRTFGRRWALYIVHMVGIHRDDYEATAWKSLSSVPAKWTFVQVHLDDGRTLESVFGAIPERDIPGVSLTINDDGILLYVTATYDKEMKRNEMPIRGNDDDFIVTYVDRAHIRQLEVGWRKK